MEVGIRELKAHLSRYVRCAQAGQTVTVTDRGTVVAVLGPPPASSRADMPAALQEMIATGRATPASRTGDLADFDPVPTGLSAQEVLDADRGVE